ncbi:hypothetical protein K449DRAFT_265811 [Hypoxylon sp. EC38]|nr:hypothetical protein K449DRAFT_265811 [Hypoxylon sp. EC38]
MVSDQYPRNDVPNTYKLIAEETLRTLGLLISATDNGFVKFQNTHRGSPIDDRARFQPPPSRRVAEYFIWRSRLQILEKEFDNSFPRTLVGWWHDRRNRKDWFTFWIAFSALVFAVLAFIAVVVSSAYSLNLGKQSLTEAKLANSYASSASASAAADTHSSSDPLATLVNNTYTITNCFSAACYFGNDAFNNALIRSDSIYPDPTGVIFSNVPGIDLVVTSTISTIIGSTTVTTTEGHS